MWKLAIKWILFWGNEKENTIFMSHFEYNFISSTNICSFKFSSLIFCFVFTCFDLVFSVFVLFWTVLFDLLSTKELQALEKHWWIFPFYFIIYANLGTRWTVIRIVGSDAWATSRNYSQFGWFVHAYCNQNDTRYGTQSNNDANYQQYQRFYQWRIIGPLIRIWRSGKQQFLINFFAGLNLFYEFYNINSSLCLWK